eukprot:3322414-Pyramimonas_sp.AAC.1
MGPKRRADALPKACEELKAMLGDNVSAEGIQNASGALRNHAFGGMRTALDVLNPEKAAQFRELENDAQRRAWLAEYLLDPKSGGC